MQINILILHMKNYIEQCLRQDINIIENKTIYNDLPLKYKGLYSIYNIFIKQIEWIILKPKTKIHLNDLRRDHKQIEKITHLNVVFYFEKISTYAKNIMLEEGIPFIVKDKQLYLPFYGMILSDKNNKKLAPIQRISFLTQKILLLALYENWENMNVTSISKRLDVSKMSVSRCFDEIEYLDIDILDTSKTSRKINVKDNSKLLYEKIKPFLRNPVIAKYELSKDIKLDKIAGISALSAYSLLEDNEYPTYAVLKKDIKKLDIKNLTKYKEENIGCVVLELGYFIDIHKNGIVDPVSVLLSLTDEELDDERIELSSKQMMEDYVW